jgi:hypothetical protein
MPAGGQVGAAQSGVAGYIAAWQPSSVPAEAARFARTVVTAAAPGGCQRARNLLRAAGKLAGYGIGHGLESVPEVLLHPSVTGRFTRTDRACPARRDRPAECDAGIGIDRAPG